jgi:hypothetical protein
LAEAEIGDVFNRARNWPAELRERAAYLLRELELGDDAAYDVFPEQWKGIEAGRAEARAGRFASATAVAEAYSTPRYAVRHTEYSLISLHEIRAFVESPMVWLIAPGLLQGAIVQLGIDPWTMGVATTIEGVRCHVVPVIRYAIYYTIDVAETVDATTVTILDIAYGPRLAWAPAAEAAA